MVLKVCSKRICNARVAQWWSIALPRRGSRVRIPSRALNDTKKEISVGYLLFCMFEPCRVRTVGMSTLRSGRRSRTSPGRSATSRALKEIEKESSDGWLFFLVCAPWARSNGCKSRIRPDSGKYIAEQQGCLS